MEYKIQSEEQAFEILQQALAGELDNEVISSIKFEGWPKVEIRLAGSGYDSTITPELAQAFLHVQQAVNKAYARVVRHETNGRALKSSEKESLRLKAKVEKGSTNLTVDFGSVAETITREVVGKMTGTELIITILGLGTIWAAKSAYAHYLNKRSEDKAVDVQSAKEIAMTEQHTKQMEIFAKAMAERPVLVQANNDFDDARHEMLKAVADAKSISFQGMTLSNESAKAIASSHREVSKEVQLNDNYVILSVDHSKENEVRLGLSRTKDGLEFSARFEDRSLKQDQIQKLKDAQWARSKVYLSINANELRGEITKATVISVDVQPVK